MRNRLLGVWIRPAALAAAVALSAGIGMLMAADTPAPDKGQPAQPQLQVGKPAPDFELPLMKAETNDKGEKTWRITDDKIKLSSFRGKKVVVVFMSSYT